VARRVEPRTVALIRGAPAASSASSSPTRRLHRTKPQSPPSRWCARAYAAKVSGELNALATSPLKARVVGSLGEAEREIRSDQVSAAFAVATGSTTDRLLVTSAGGASVVSAVTA